MDNCIKNISARMFFSSFSSIAETPPRQDTPKWQVGEILILAELSFNPLEQFQ